MKDMEKGRYQPLPQHDHSRCSLSEAGVQDSCQTPWTHPPSRIHLWSWIAQLLFFITSTTFFFMSQPSVPKSRPVEQLSPYSPALEAISDTYEWQRFNGTVLGESPYRGPPDNETLARWHEYTTPPVFRLSHEELMKVAPTDPDSAVQFPDGGYMGWLEVYHHMHCLEELWKHTWPEFYQVDHGEQESMHRQHLDHCADLLRQKLLCDGDVSVVTFSWVKHFSHPTPNFNVLHKCRNFDSIRAWSDEHKVLSKDGEIGEKPANAVELENLP